MSRRDEMAFVQIGATRDGLDSYIDAARARGLRTVLVETPDYLHWRRCLGRRPFDVEIAVDHPAEPDDVCRAVHRAGLSPTLVLAGFERYVDGAFAAAPRLEVARSGAASANPGFRVPDKAAQRRLLERHLGRAGQPRYAVVALTSDPAEITHDLGYPLVVKPTDGGGGLGVFLVDDAKGLAEALGRLRSLRNYDGSGFTTALLEQFMAGVEFSVQGLACNGDATVLSVCEKITHQELVRGSPGLRGFREAGHIATHGARAHAAIRQLAQDAVTATGYRNGPFHVDMIVHEGDARFLEMGFRLSGAALVSLVAQSTGIDWSDLVFRVLLAEGGITLPEPAEPARFVGQLACLCEAELNAGRRLAAEGLVADVLPLRRDPTLNLADMARQHPTLASDLLRHGDILGRLRVSGDSAASVRAALTRCLADRDMAPCAD